MSDELRVASSESGIASLPSQPATRHSQLELAIALTSAAALAYEILLIRLFAITDWHHLAFLVISLALLGYGASGTLLALTRERLLRRFDAAAATSAAGFGVTSIGAFLLSQRIELNSLEIFWSTRQFGTLFLFYLLFAVPFFCAATAIGLALTRYGEESPRLYRADLLGGGIAAAAVTALLFVVHPVTALTMVSACGFLAAALFARRASLLIGIVIVIAARPVALPLRISQFKELSHALRVPEARVMEERSSPLAMLTAVESPAVPFRHAPGLALTFAGEIPNQIGIFTDGGGLTPVLPPTANRQPPTLAYLDALPTAVAYHVGAPKQRVAVIGSGGGAEVLSALAHGARHVTAVELNPQVVAVVRERSRIYDDPRVRVVTAEARRFIRESSDRYDVIQIALVGSHGASASGVQALSESYLYTVEAMREMVAHLNPGGVLVITRWMQSPPREVVKLLATATEDRAHGVALIRGWNTATVIVKRGEIAPSAVEALRRFCEERSFDLDFAPGVKREETNQYNVVEDSLFDMAAALRGPEREDFLERYKFHVRPATDERPYFFHFFRWSALPELLRLRARGGMPLLEWGYLVLVAGLAQALVAALVLILLPLALFRRGPAIRLAGYFGSIGLGFLFLEIAFMQRLTLFLGHPLYAIAIVLASFLVFGGLGSGASARLGSRRAPLIVAALAVVALLVVRFLPLGLPDIAKIAISIALIAPLAFAMGMPFPFGLRRLASDDIPWAWGINGTASVIASMLATLVAVHFGFSVLVLLAAALYCGAYVTSRGSSENG